MSRIRHPIILLILLVTMSGAFLVWKRSRDNRPNTPTDTTVETVSLTTPRGKLAQETIRERLSAGSGGWNSEVFAEQASFALNKIAARLSDKESASETQLGDWLANDFSFSPLRCADDLVYENERVRIWRGRANGNARRAGASRFTSALDELTAAFAVIDYAKIKLVAVEMHDETIESRALLTIVGQTETGRLQQNAAWHLVWTSNGDRQQSPKVRLKELRVTDYEEIVANDASPWFSDRTNAVVGQTDVFREQLSRGLQHWLARIEYVHGMNYFTRQGITVGDVNGDGYDDVYLCQPGGLPNRLFLQKEDGSVREASASWGVDFLDRTASALLVDLDNDGDQDMALATFEGVIVLENVGGSFQQRVRHLIGERDLQSLSSVDYDNDRDLDIYVTVDFASSKSRETQNLPAFVYHDANDGGSNQLLRNDIEGTSWVFADVTRETGLDENNQRHGLAAAWEDCDNDGDQDLYVANDYGQNNLYINDNGRFVDKAGPKGVMDYGSGMSASWADYDRDGHPDLYVGNMFSSAGNRITTQSRFLADADSSTRQLYRRFAKGNSLFRNLGDGKFAEVGDEAKVEMGRWAWSSVFADINNDGWQDLFVANGYITTEDTGDL